MTFTFKTNPRVIGDQAIRTIALKGQPILKEANLISGTIKPGQLVEFVTSATGKHGIRLQSVEGQNCRRAVAMEMDLLGKTVEDSYEISVADNDGKNSHVRYGAFHQGQEVAVRFLGIHAVKIGSALQADGNGNVEIRTGVNTIIAYSLEQFTTTAGANTKLIAVEIV